MTWANDDLEVVEAMIVTVFTFCPVSISNPEDHAFKDLDPFSIKGKGIREWLRQHLMPTVKMLADLVRAIYIAWFWFVGIDRQNLSPCTGYAFFFAKVSASGWFHTLARILSVGGVAALLVQIALVLTVTAQSAAAEGPPQAPAAQVGEGRLLHRQCRAGDLLEQHPGRQHRARLCGTDGNDTTRTTHFTFSPSKN